MPQQKRLKLLKDIKNFKVVGFEAVARYLGFHVTHDARLLPSSEGLLCYRTSVMWMASIESDRILVQDLDSLYLNRVDVVRCTVAAVRKLSCAGFLSEVGICRQA